MNTIKIFIILFFFKNIEQPPQLMITGGPAFIPPFAQQPAYGYSPQPPQFNTFNPY